MSYSDLYQNATTLITDFAKQATTRVDDLYTGFDLTQLNWFEQLWVKWYTWIGNPILATGIMSFVMHELVYFGRCLPWMAIDAMPYFRQWKIQPDKVPSREQQWQCTKYVLKTHFSVELPQIYLFHPMAVACGMKTFEVPFPSWQTQLTQLVAFFFMEDAWHYFAHRLLHHKRIYKHIHKLHHEFSAPFGLAAEYAHPIEVLVLGMGTVGGPLLYCYLSGGNMHIVTVYIWIMLRLFQAVDAHSGYDFPWSLHNWFPLWAGADHHDWHHSTFTNCFSTSFRYLDYIFGTDESYNKHAKAVREAKKRQVFGGQETAKTK